MVCYTFEAPVGTDTVPRILAWSLGRNILNRCAKSSTLLLAVTSAGSHCTAAPHTRQKSLANLAYTYVVSLWARHCTTGNRREVYALHWISRPFAERLIVVFRKPSLAKKPMVATLQPFAIVDIFASVPMQSADPFHCDGFVAKFVQEKGMYPSSISTDADGKIKRTSAP